MSANRLPLVLAALVGFAAASASAEQPVPAELRGDWVPASADCKSALRFRVGVDQVTLVNGKDEAAFGKLAWPTSYFGPDYTGISRVAIPDGDSGNQLFTIYFNADEQKGVTKVVMEEGVERPEPAFAAYAEIFRKAKDLSRRFPLNNAPLKQCAGATDPAKP